MPGTHVQKVRVTLPPLLLPLVLLAPALLGAELLLLQAAKARIPAAAPAASSLRRSRGLRPALRINDVIVLLPPTLL
jgi:hypothetical protein